MARDWPVTVSYLAPSWAVRSASSARRRGPCNTRVGDGTPDAACAAAHGRSGVAGRQCACRRRRAPDPCDASAAEPDAGVPGPALEWRSLAGRDVAGIPFGEVRVWAAGAQLGSAAAARAARRRRWRPGSAPLVRSAPVPTQWHRGAGRGGAGLPAGGVTAAPPKLPDGGVTPCRQCGVGFCSVTPGGGARITPSSSGLPGLRRSGLPPGASEASAGVEIGGGLAANGLGADGGPAPGRVGIG